LIGDGGGNRPGIDDHSSIIEHRVIMRHHREAAFRLELSLDG
jgi:hypothetical protein